MDIDRMTPKEQLDMYKGWKINAFMFAFIIVVTLIVMGGAYAYWTHPEETLTGVFVVCLITFAGYIIRRLLRK